MGSRKEIYQRVIIKDEIYQQSTHKGYTNVRDYTVGATPAFQLTTNIFADI